MGKFPASTGWSWIKQGFGLFRQQPGGLFMLMLAYMVMVLLIGIIPVLGQLLPLVVTPVFTAIFMHACMDIEAKRRITPLLLRDGFRSPALPKLLALGALYIIAGAIALGASTLVDDGMFLKLATGQVKPDPQAMADSNMGSAMLLTMALYVPAAMAFYFSAPLVYWQQMSVGKAVFFSFFSVLRALKAFAVYVAAWTGIFMLVTQLVLLVFGRSQFGLSMMTPVYMVLMLVIQCSAYASYRQVFGAPPGAEPEAPGSPGSDAPV